MADAGRTAPSPVPASAPVPHRRRVRTAVPLLSPPPSSLGFSNLKPAAFPARAGASRRERAGPHASQPRLGVSGPAPRVWPRPARTCRAGPRLPGPARLRAAGVWAARSARCPGCPAGPCACHLPTEAPWVRLGGKRRDGQVRAGRPRFPGAEPGRGGRGWGGPCVCGTVSVTLKQKWGRGCQRQHPQSARRPLSPAWNPWPATSRSCCRQQSSWRGAKEVRADPAFPTWMEYGSRALARCLPHIHGSSQASGQGVAGERVLAPKAFP